ncbi:MAG: hypothetical protein ACXABG_08435, partial [Promethearchaeota archaeon]
MQQHSLAILEKYKNITFGDITIDEECLKFYKQLNKKILYLCKSLPASVQTDALIFLMNYVNTKIGEPFDFFKYYFAPIWTILFWLLKL